MPGYPSLLVRAGFGVQEVCHHPIWRPQPSRHRGAIFRFVSVRKLRLILPREPASAPLLTDWRARRARSHGK